MQGMSEKFTELELRMWGSVTLGQLARSLGVQPHELAAYLDLGAIGDDEVLSDESVTIAIEAFEAARESSW